LCAAAIISLEPATAASRATAAASKITIAFDQGYCGNGWRITENDALFAEAKQLEQAGQLASYKYLCASGSVTTQESQMADLVIEHPSVIIVDPQSGTALNGVIAKAYAVHIPVLVLDAGPVTSTLPYELNADNPDRIFAIGQYLANRLHGVGNIFEDRGIAGNLAEADYHAALLAAFKPYPKIHIVKSVWGDWTDSVSEEATAAVISALPTINAVVCQEGCYGVLEAFKAAGRPVPLINGDNEGYFVKWWSSEYKATGYTTISLQTNPGIGGAGMYVADQIARGEPVPKYMYMPLLPITAATLSQFSYLPDNATTASKTYSNSWYQANIIDKPVSAKSYETIP
jgi:ribose transport system substrate-binding protein